MEKLLFMCIVISHCSFLKALFTVEVFNPPFIAEYGSNVTMECRFPVNGQFKLEQLSIVWEKKEETNKNVYKIYKGKEDFKSQDRAFKNRTTLFKDKLSLGHIVLQISSVKLTDAGTYLCLVEYDGVDYKYLPLDVKAPYRNIISTSTPVQAIGGHKGWELACQSEGYPEAEVFWHTMDGADLSDKANVSYMRGSDQLYHVTSTLRVNTNITDTFYCVFWNEPLQQNTTAALIVTGEISKHYSRCMRTKGSFTDYAEQIHVTKISNPGFLFRVPS
ncbi:programmed cell death 1 ligand 1-like [Elgaria multicarinata webbii]|uniref:programmed cell death 1 ligand 1-like n=1 Tax=Elgaria multicarinata webbii TaxID=159646 RepID=UPI002FCD5408